MGRGSETQLQMGENFNFIYNILFSALKATLTVLTCFDETKTIYEIVIKVLVSWSALSASIILIYSIEYIFSSVHALYFF